MDDFRITFRDRETPLDYDRLVGDLRAAILTITRLGLGAINGDIRSGGPLSLAVLEAQAGGSSPEFPPEFRRVLGALKHLVLALGCLSPNQPAPCLGGWDPRAVADYLLEAERVVAATEESR